MANVKVIFGSTTGATESAAAEIAALRALGEAAENGGGGKFAELQERFALGIPTADETAEIEQLIKEYSAAEAEYLAEPEFTEREKPKAAAKKSKALPVAIVGGVIAVFGIVAFAINAIAGGIILAIGLIALAASAFISVNGKMDALRYEVEKERVPNAEKQRLKDRLIEINRPIERFFIKYGYREGGYEARFALIKKDAADYKEMLRAAEESKKRGKEREEKAERLEGEIRAVFEPRKIYEGNLSETVKAIRKFIIERNGLEGRIKSSAAEAQAYAEAKNLKERPDAEKTDVGALIKSQRELSAQITSLEKDIRDGEWEAERLDDLISLKSKSDEKLKEYSEKHKLLSAAAEFLEDAEKKIIEKYVSPIKREFTKYSLAIEKAFGERVGMNKNFEISFEEGGKERSEIYKSQGERSVIALCFRLALIENMYGGEKPFLVLDDPFVHLDNEHMGKVVELLKELSGGFQMLYFTCHDSRQLKVN